ncbi:MAG TPA: zinc metallopeptidase [Spirochaetota bacterium]|nr:zinc metallopeptidase [Spirochaetota bacterium]HOM37543.1 zinc metallopeptidase [Spirochaetota bacterium]HPQ49485.1 zinc metallopeptidase [Spirochaetota bacterium]
MLFFDSTYIIVLPALILAIWAQYKVKYTFNHFSKYRILNGRTAREIARDILNYYGLSYVKIERVEGSLTDHYDPRSKVLRLSDDVYESSSIAAIGVAAHEAGHAIQHNKGYAPLALRNSFVPVVNLVSWAAFPLFILGFFLHNPLFVKLGIIFFSGVVLFQIITLPVEFDASRRALKILKSGYLNSYEYEGAKKVLQAAALTYIASALMGILELLRLILIARGNDD